MGARKHNSAEKNKEAKKNKCFARLNNCPTSPRKMRLVAGLIRGVDAEKAIHILKHSPQEAAGRLHILLLSGSLWLLFHKHIVPWVAHTLDIYHSLLFFTTFDF